MPSRLPLGALVLVSSLAFSACKDSQNEGTIDAGSDVDAGVDAGVSPADAPLAQADAPLDQADAPLVEADAPLPLPDAPPAADAPSAVDALIPDAFQVGDAGVTLTKTFSFTVDAEGFTQSFADNGAAETWQSDDGDPPGALKFTAVSAGTVKVLSPPSTWETWGVPPGAQVIDVGISSYKRRLEALTDMDHSWAFQIVGADNQPAHDGLNGAYLEITSLTHTPQAAWETVTGLQRFEVRGPYRASNTPIFVKIWYFPLLAGSVDWRLDEIQLDIIYIMP